MCAMASQTELKVIGAGFGRTGTTSLKKALEILGLGPCFHLNEIIDGPDEQVKVFFKTFDCVLQLLFNLKPQKSRVRIKTC